MLPPLLLHGYSDREMHLQLGMCMSELAEQLTGASGLGNNAHVQQPLSLLRSPVVYEVRALGAGRMQGKLHAVAIKQ